MYTIQQLFMPTHFTDTSSTIPPLLRFNSGITLLHKQICDAHYSETRCLPNKTDGWNRVKIQVGPKDFYKIYLTLIENLYTVNLYL